MFCVAIEQELRGHRCPLAVGRCMWQQRKTHACCYVDRQLDTREFCERVGIPEPTHDEIQAFLTELKESL